MQIAVNIARVLMLHLALAATATLAADSPSIAQSLQAPNVVPVSSMLVTSGQPTSDSLAHLADQGFGAVIYLAPLTVPDAVPREEEIVRSQGLEFVNIPIKFNNPTEADFQSFVEEMNRLRGRKVLVHCQVNMRASTMAFLYRVIVEKENPEQAYEAVARVWSPQGSWKKLISLQLHNAGIAFEPY